MILTELILPKLQFLISQEEENKDNPFRTSMDIIEQSILMRKEPVGSFYYHISRGKVMFGQLKTLYLLNHFEMREKNMFSRSMLS